MESELLKLELCELNTFVRHHFQLYLGWYTFFLTVNFGAIGWFTSVMLTGALKVSLPVVFIALFFVAQLIFSYIASRQVRRYLIETVQRINEILAQLSDAGPGSPSYPKTAIPLPIYLRIISLICSTLISFMLFWIALTLVSIHLVPL
jgi:hypothetical protein